MSAVTPDTEDRDGVPVPFIARWNALVAVLIVEPSVKLVAMQAAQYGIYDGCGIYPGNERLARETGYDSETVRRAWGILRGTGMAIRATSSEWDGKRRTADSYWLEIPGNWKSMPVYGPSHGRFHCQQCGSAYNPRPGTILRPDGSVRWLALRMAFCPDKGRPKRAPGAGGRLRPKPAGCLANWDAGSGRAAKADNPEVWKLFRSARGEDWLRVRVPKVRWGTRCHLGQHPNVRSGTTPSELGQHPQVSWGQLALELRIERPRHNGAPRSFLARATVFSERPELVSHVLAGAHPQVR